MAYKPNYRPDSNVFRTARAQNPHDIISMHQTDSGAAKKARHDHITTLLEDAHKDEIEAIKKYSYISDEIEKYQRGIPELRDIITHIKNQEIQHKSLLEKLL